MPTDGASRSDPGELPAALRGLTGRPYVVELGPGPGPESLLRRLGGRRHPGALWGDWFTGGVVLFHTPLRALAPVNALAAVATLDDQPQLDQLPGVPPDTVGGGWLSCLGYTPGTTWFGFYDSLLRCRDSLWTFESLGLSGRDEAMTSALDDWRRLLAGPEGEVDVDHGRDVDPGADASSDPRWRVGTFATMTEPAHARQRHLAAVEQAIGRIHRGDFYQVNLCTRLQATFDGDPVAWFADAAAELQPAWGALVNPGRDAAPETLASFSPELFLRVRGRRVTTAPIKGTAPRGVGEVDSPALRASAKDAAENIMIVDLMRNDLSRVSRPGSVLVEDLLALEPHPGVWHLVSRISGELRPEVNLAALLRASFPPGSVTGAPKLAAIRATAELEAQRRGAYTGAVGFSSPLAGTDFNVAIRTFEVTTGQVQLGVGGGITADSVPVREWAECLDKAAPLVAAARARLAPGLTPAPVLTPERAAAGVFETLLSYGSRVLRLAAHLARLDRSCRELYGRGVPEDLSARVSRAAAEQTSGAGRHAVRIFAEPRPSGLAFTVTVGSVGSRTAESRLVYGVRGPGPWRHKWHDRSDLVRAESAAGDRQPYFVTGEGDVAETSRGNLFCRTADGLWLTPPLDEDVLPGVTRRDVLDLFADHQLDVSLQPFSPHTLKTASAAFWTSSLSGAVSVTEVDSVALPRAPAVLDLVNKALGFDPPQYPGPNAHPNVSDG